MASTVCFSLLLLLNITICVSFLHSRNVCESEIVGDSSLRPPSVPLVVTNPYNSVWSNYDNATQGWPTHWTGSPKALQSLCRIDGVAFRLLGGAGSGSESIPPLAQDGTAEVTATSTTYRYVVHNGVRITLTFLSPIRADDLETFRPLTYVTWNVEAIDKNAHTVQLYFDIDGEHAVNSNSEMVVWSRLKSDHFQAMRIGTKAQSILGHLNGCINWGYAYLAVPTSYESEIVLSSSILTRKQFAVKGTLPSVDDTRMPRAVSDNWIVAAGMYTVTLTSTVAQQERWMMLAYDDFYAVELDHTKLRAWWRRSFSDNPPETAIKNLLSNAATNYLSEVTAARKFDQKLFTDLKTVGGAQYAAVGALTYRQTIGAHTLASLEDGKTPVHFSRECGSGDDILTADVIIDSLPFFLYFNTEILKAQLRPLMDLALNHTTHDWKHPFAPHDMGHWPIANAYDGGPQEDMPLEETGNIMIMMAALSWRDNNTVFVEQYWDQLELWTEYLCNNGLYPKKQKSSDDFDGPIANNTNLAVKSIIGIGAFAVMCKHVESCDSSTATKYQNIAKDFAIKWEKLALATNGDHYTLKYGDDSSWSMLYNIWFDDLLNLNLFSPHVYDTLKQFYSFHTNKYGLPLDERHSWTIQPWMTWIYSLHVYSMTEFCSLFSRTYAWVNESPSRWPLTDWYDTKTGVRAGFMARSMWGGIWSQLFSSNKHKMK